MGANQTSPDNLKVIEATRDVFKKHKIKIDVEIDGTDAENHDLRKKLFEISGEPGTYPQIFSKDNDEYVLLAKGEEVTGMDEMFEAVNEMVKNDPKFLEEHEEIRHLPV